LSVFLNFKTAAGLSQRSVSSYQRILEQWAEYAGDKKVSQFSDHDINAYLVYMRTVYVPRRFGGDTRALSPKSLRNIWISLCAFFTWAHDEFKMKNLMKSVPAPKFKAPDIEPFTQDEIERMLKACTFSREAETFIRRKFAMRRPTANRDQAIIFTLLDSRIPASEFSSLRVGILMLSEDSWISVMVRKVGRKAGRGELSIWEKLLAMPSGAIWLSEKTEKTRMHRCLSCAAIVVSIQMLCGT
jgi:integrase